MVGTTRMSVGVVGTLALAISVALLTGCTPQAPRPAQSPAATTTASPSANAGASTGSTPAPGPTFAADGTAQANKAYFDSINQALIAGNNSVTGKAIIDSLIAAGFDRASMQVTPDKTSINVNADSVLFSVRIGDSCLLGQHSGSEFVSSVQKVLHSGVCLVGRTRPIDW